MNSHGKITHPGPKPALWDLRFVMLAATFALLWVYLVAQGATAFRLVSKDNRGRDHEFQTRK